MSEQILMLTSKGTAEKERPALPILSFPESFLTTIVNETLNHLDDDETGGFILGLRVKGGLFPLGSFTPPEFKSEISRKRYSLLVGGKLSRDYYDWQKDNWPFMFSKYLSEFEERCSPYFTFEPEDRYQPESGYHELQVLGIWHKHPGAMADYSGDDSRTVNRHLDWGLPDYLFPIVIVRKKNHFGRFPPPTSLETYRINVDRKIALDINFYYRTGTNRVTRKLKTDSLQLRDSSFFPCLAPTPWFVDNPKLLMKETKRFKSFGYEASLVITEDENHSELTKIYLELAAPKLAEPLYVETTPEFHRDGVFTLILSGHKIPLFKAPNSTIADTINAYFRLRPMFYINEVLRRKEGRNND